MRHIDLSGHQRDNFLFRFGEAAYIESGSGSRYLQVSRTDDERMLLVRMYLKVGFSGHSTSRMLLVKAVGYFSVLPAFSQTFELSGSVSVDTVPYGAVTSLKAIRGA